MGGLTLLLFLQQQSSSTEIQLYTHHDIVKQYRKGLTAVVDICVVYTYPTIVTALFRKVLFVAVLVETRAC